MGFLVVNVDNCFLEYVLYSVNYNKLHVSAGNGHHQVFFFFENALGGTIQFAKRRIDEEISSSVFRYLRIVL